jgi:hypothetical protein
MVKATVVGLHNVFKVFDMNEDFILETNRIFGFEDAINFQPESAFETHPDIEVVSSVGNIKKLLSSEKIGSSLIIHHFDSSGTRRIYKVIHNGIIPNSSYQGVRIYLNQSIKEI